MAKSKRRFRIDAGNYGGELTVGTVDESFVEHFANNESDGDLLEVLHSYEWDDEDGMDPDIPKPGEDFYAWSETDDIAHVNCCYSDSVFSWCEVPIDESDDFGDSDENQDEYVSKMQDFEPYHLYERETFHESSKPHEDDIKEGDEWIPVLVYHSADKGGHGSWFAETNGEDFDPNKVMISSVATHVASIVEDVWYDKKMLEQDMEWADTWGKGDYAEVGWMNYRWHDTLESTQTNIKAYWEDHENSLA